MRPALVHMATQVVNFRLPGLAQRARIRSRPTDQILRPGEAAGEMGLRGWSPKAYAIIRS